MRKRKAKLLSIIHLPRLILIPILLRLILVILQLLLPRILILIILDILSLVDTRTPPNPADTHNQVDIHHRLVIPNQVDIRHLLVIPHQEGTHNRVILNRDIQILSTRDIQDTRHNNNNHQEIKETLY